MNYEVLIDKLMQHFTSAPFEKEVELANSQFHQWAGQFDEMSKNFENKVAQFTDWYLFIRPFEKFQKPPIQLNPEEGGFQLKPQWKPAYEGLMNSRHSLFEFVKVKQKDLYIKDIFSDYKLTIENSPILYGFNKGDIFEARLIPVGDSFVLSNSFCFHPPQATKYILAEVKRINKLETDQLESREALIHKLFKMRYKLEHFVRLQPQDVYTDQPRPEKA